MNLYHKAKKNARGVGGASVIPNSKKICPDIPESV
jgi:hypothetical protein